MPLEMLYEPEPNSGCWLWTGVTVRHGYGIIQRDGKYHCAHRYVYEYERGPIPEGLTLDHLCRVRSCVNPAHLEPVDLRTNTLRGEGITAQNARKTECPRGHSYSWTTDGKGGRRRYCYPCLRAGFLTRKLMRTADHA